MSAAGRPQPRVLIVHEDAAVLHSARRVLRDYDYEIRIARDTYSALDLARTWTPQVVLASFAGDPQEVKQFCGRIKAASKAQVLAVLTDRPGNMRMAALEAGADDYIASPLIMPDLLARVQLGVQRANRCENEVRHIQTADLWIDLEERRVVACGHEQHLALKEFELLRCLVVNANRVVSHQQLWKAIGRAVFKPGGQSLRVYIRQLRKKLEPCPDQPRYIRTEARVGYRFQVPPSNLTNS